MPVFAQIRTSHQTFFKFLIFWELWMMISPQKMFKNLKGVKHFIGCHGGLVGSRLTFSTDIVSSNPSNKIRKNV